MVSEFGSRAHAAARLEGWVGLAASFAVGIVAALGGALLAHRLPGPRQRATGPAAVDFTGSQATV